MKRYGYNKYMVHHYAYMAKVVVCVTRRARLKWLRIPIGRRP